jgi:hypothetical protein
VAIDMRLTSHSIIATALALSAVTGVAVAGVVGDEPQDDPDVPTGAVEVRAEPVREGAGPARIVVTREPGAAARLSWATRPGTATAGDDYDAATGLVQFRAGEHTRIVEVPVDADGRAEGAETFDVRFDVLPGLNTAAKTAVTTVTILD